MAMLDDHESLERGVSLAPHFNSNVINTHGREKRQRPEPLADTGALCGSILETAGVIASRRLPFMFHAMEKQRLAEDLQTLLTDDLLTADFIRIDIPTGTSAEAGTFGRLVESHGVYGDDETVRIIVPKVDVVSIDTTMGESEVDTYTPAIILHVKTEPDPLTLPIAVCDIATYQITG